jgi:chromosome segregation ATPase
LTSEKYHLELSLNEANDQRVQYRDKSERLQKLNEDIFNEMQDYKMQLVGVQEIKKDRDDRIDKLRAELDSITRKYDLLEREHTSMKVNYQHVQDEHATLKADFDNVSEKLHLSNKVRNEKEDLLADKIKQMH